MVGQASKDREHEFSVNPRKKDLLLGLPQHALFLDFRNDYATSNSYLNIGTTLDKNVGLRLTTPTLSRVFEQIGTGLIRTLDALPDELGQQRTLLVGCSGDLDSSFLLTTLAHVKAMHRLPWDIRAFHAKKDFQPKRAARIGELMDYINRDRPLVELTTFDIKETERAMREAIRGSYNGPPQRKSNSDDPSKDPDTSTMIHDLMGVIKGFMARNAKLPALLLSPQEATEVLIHNFPFQDIAPMGPMIHLPKTTVAESFKQIIDNSEGGLQMDTWGYSLSEIVPLRINGANVQGNIVGRPGRNITEYATVTIDPETSNLPEEQRGIVGAEGRYIRLPGNLQYLMDPYLHVFVTEGFTRTIVDRLVSAYPMQRTDIEMAAFLFANARENSNKDRLILSVARVV